MDSKRKMVIQTMVCCGLLCLIWGGYLIARNYGIERILDIKEDDFSWVYQVDNVKREGKNLVIQGFAFEIGRTAEKGDFEIVLQDIESGKRYFPEMKYIERTDVNEYFLCEYDYVHSGFLAMISEKKLRLEERNYEVLLKERDGKRTYQTGTYISCEGVVYADPDEFKPLNVSGTDLEEIVENGILRVYRPDFGMYVYQYNGELYWIAEAEYGFVEGDTYVQYQLETTQIDKLPEIRLMNHWYTDNIGFMFSDNELLNMDTGIYRVTKKAIPTDYSITTIWTGNYMDGWIWRQGYRLYYEFEG